MNNAFKRELENATASLSEITTNSNVKKHHDKTSTLLLCCYECTRCCIFVKEFRSMTSESNDYANNPNPIDADKITETPHILPYAHTVGGAVIRPEDEGKVKGNALSAMAQQTEMQLQQLYEQMQVLADQANAIKRRVEISRIIYQADMAFDPIIGKTYHLYKRKNGSHVLTMVSPQEWGRTLPYEAHVASANLMADHTWHVIDDANL